MYRICRAFQACRRHQYLRGVAVLLAALVWSPNAFAQSAIGNPVNTATGRSLADAASHNLNEFLDQHGLSGQGGGTAGGGGGGGPGGAAAVTGALGTGSMPSGRLRTTEHEGLKPASSQAYSYNTGETSAFANLVVLIPGTVLGGQLKFSAMVGTNNVDVKLRSNIHAALDPGQSGTGSNESLMAGGTALWSSGSTYALGSLIGFWGQTKLSDRVDACDASGCNLQRYEFDTSGLMATVAAGQVFDFAGPSGPKLDLRGTLAYIENKGDHIRSIFGFDQRWSFSTWTGTFGATVFTNVATSGGGILRPYLQAQVRQEWAYSDVLVARAVGGDEALASTFKHEQNHTYGGLSAGVTYNLDRLTFGAAVYTDYSGDERTLGGRLGASLQLGGDNPKRASAAPPPAANNGWSGLYVGAHAGYGFGDVTMSNLGPDVFFGAVGASDTLSARGGLGGAQFGYNWQVGTLVFGLEGAWDVLALTEDRRDTFSEKDHWRTDVSQIYSIAGRLGMAAGSWLPYLKGGFAGASIETSMVRPAEPNWISASTNWHSGWTIGGGAEYMFAPGWTMGVEYDRYSFGRKNIAAVRTGAPGIPETGVTDHWTVKPDNIQTVTARMNFKFN